MGSTLSTCSNECIRQYATGMDKWVLNGGTGNGSGAQRFSAEVYRLSDDKRQWVKVHPEMLAIQLRTRQNNPTLLEAAALNRKAMDKDVILTLQISQGTELKRYTDKFVYWRQSENGEKSQSTGVYALNLMSSRDLDQFCSAINCLPPMPFGMPKVDEQIFDAHLAPLMALHHARIEENPVPLFTKCTVQLRQVDAIIQVLDDRSNLMARMDAAECIFCICTSNDDPTSQLTVSFPTRALLLQFPSSRQQLTFCRQALNASSAKMANSKEVEATNAFLRERMDALDCVLGQLNSTDTATSSNFAQIPAMLHCECDCFAATTRRRQSMAGLLRYALRSRMAALCGDNQKLAEILENSSANFPPSTHHKSRHIVHRVHLQAQLNCKFSLKKTIELLGQAQALKLDGQQANEEGIGKFAELKLDAIPSTSTGIVENPATQIQRILLELLQSERAFVQDLQTLLTRFVLPSGLQFLQCVRELCRVHAHFLRSLEAAMGQAVGGQTAMGYEELKPIIVRLCALFISKCAQFKVYSEYTFAHMHFQHLRNENAAFEELIASFSAPIGGTRCLESLLIKPVQRLLKYPLFLGQIREFCVEGSDERAHCLKALKQMRTLANWLNEMQRIQEDYGHELVEIGGPTSGDFGCLTPRSMGNANTNFADLNALQLFAHVRWMNPPTTNGEVPHLNCAFFVFHMAVVVLERRRKQQQQEKTQKLSTLPLVLPTKQIQLLLPQQTTAENSSKNCCPNENNPSKPVEPLARFALAIRAQTDPQQMAPKRMMELQQQLPPARIFHFECCHPDVCHHLALALRQPKQPSQNGQDEEKFRLSTWRMETSFDSSCSSSSDRGYSSGGGQKRVSLQSNQDPILEEKLN